jgi:hypothetical protein
MKCIKIIAEILFLGKLWNEKVAANNRFSNFYFFFWE